MFVKLIEKNKKLENILKYIFEYKHLSFSVRSYVFS